jgi:hypothetical protein
MAAASMRALATTFPKNYAPAFSEVKDDRSQPGISLPGFMVDEVLTCREGYVAEEGVPNQGLQRVFNERTAPIAAAVRIDIYLPVESE